MNNIITKIMEFRFIMEVFSGAVTAVFIIYFILMYFLTSKKHDNE